MVKAVIRGIAPRASVIDLTHELPPHDVRAGALTLARCAQYLPAGVVLAIVDPGVGTDRRAIAVEAGDADRPLVLVGPDNGLLAPAVAMSGGAQRAVELTNTEYHLPAPGPTFAGRDVFGPAAAYLCNGVDLAELGEAVDPFSLRPSVIPLTRVEDDRVIAEVLWVDRFGNAQLNVDPDELAGMGERIAVRWGDQMRVGTRADTFASLGAGDLGVIVDSYGLVALAFDRRSVAEELGLGAGDTVSLGAAE